MKTIQAYRYALDLTPAQQRRLLAHAGAARVAYNWALAQVKAVMDQRTAERSYGVPDERLTERLSWSLPALRKAWNAAKAQAAPWWTEVSKEAFNTGLDALARGLKTLAADYDTAGNGPVAGRGADQKTRVRGQVAVKRQPGTASTGQTVTVPPQGGTTDRALTRAH